MITGDPILRGTLTCSDGDLGRRVRAHLPLVPVRLRTSRSADRARRTRSPRTISTRCCSARSPPRASPTARSEYIVAERPQGFQTISGLPWPGQTLVCEPGAWNDREWGRYQFTYRWFLDERRQRQRDPRCRPADVHRPSGRRRAQPLLHGLRRRLPVAVPAQRQRHLGAGGAAPGPDDDDVAPGTPNAYTLKVSNPNPQPLVLDTADGGHPRGVRLRAGLDARG